MKKICYFVFCFFTLAGCNWSNRPKYRRIALDNSLLWEISGHGLASPSYLYGTDHLIGGNFLDTIPYVMEKFRQCKALATETDWDTAPDDYKSHIFLKNDSLSNLFTNDEFSEIDKVLLHYLPWPLKRYNRFKPVYVYDDLFYYISARTASRTNHHLDRYFQDTARKMRYKTLGLETVKFHDSLLYDAPLDIQKKQLLYLVRHIDHYRKSRQKSYRLYHQQNLNALEIQTNSREVFTDARLDGAVRARNMNWLRELPAIMKQQPTFIAVGAGHLLWDCGLINQLRLKGYTVTPVKN
jgi:uncharacterized protein YbaP (TraB family)